MKRGPKKKWSSRGGLLLELMLVLFIMSLLSMRYIGNFGERYMDRQIENEDRVLADIEAAIKQSLLQTDMTNLNIAAISGEIGPTDSTTLFSTSSSPTYSTTDTRDWFSKVARLRGVTPTLGVAPSSQPALASIVYNAYGQPRLLFIRPTVGNESVELLLVSLLATSTQLQLPGYLATDTWFDTIANWDFTKRTNTIPPGWVTLLTSSQQTAWNSGTGGSNVNRLRVRRISIPKYTFSINNNSSSYYGWAYWNNGGKRVQADPGSGATTIGPIIYGRWLQVNSGLTEGASTINYKDPVLSTGSTTVK